MGNQDDEASSTVVVTLISGEQHRDIIQLVFCGEDDDPVEYNADLLLASQNLLKQVKNKKGKQPRGENMRALLNCNGGTLEYDNGVINLYKIRVRKEQNQASDVNETPMDKDNKALALAKAFYEGILARERMEQKNRTADLKIEIDDVNIAAAPVECVAYEGGSRTDEKEASFGLDTPLPQETSKLIEEKEEKHASILQSSPCLAARVHGMDNNSNVNFCQDESRKEQDNETPLALATPILNEQIVEKGHSQGKLISEDETDHAVIWEWSSNPDSRESKPVEREAIFGLDPPSYQGTSVLVEEAKEENSSMTQISSCDVGRVQGMVDVQNVDNRGEESTKENDNEAPMALATPISKCCKKGHSRLKLALEDETGNKLMSSESSLKRYLWRIWRNITMAFLLLIGGFVLGCAFALLQISQKIDHMINSPSMPPTRPPFPFPTRPPFPYPTRPPFDLWIKPFTYNPTYQSPTTPSSHLEWNIPGGLPTPDPAKLFHPNIPPYMILSPNHESPTSIHWNTDIFPDGQPTPDPAQLFRPNTPAEWKTAPVAKLYTWRSSSPTPPPTATPTYHKLSPPTRPLELGVPDFAKGYAPVQNSNDNDPTTSPSLKETTQWGWNVDHSYPTFDPTFDSLSLSNWNPAIYGIGPTPDPALLQDPATPPSLKKGTQWKWNVAYGEPTSDPAKLTDPATPPLMKINGGTSPVHIQWSWEHPDATPDPTTMPAVPPNMLFTDGSPVFLKWNIPRGLPTPDPAQLLDPATPSYMISSPNDQTAISIHWNTDFFPHGQPTPDPARLLQPNTPPEWKERARSPVKTAWTIPNPTQPSRPLEVGQTRPPTSEPTRPPTLVFSDRTPSPAPMATYYLSSPLLMTPSPMPPPYVLQSLLQKEANPLPRNGAGGNSNPTHLFQPNTPPKRIRTKTLLDESL